MIFEISSAVPPGSPKISWRGQAVAGGSLGPVNEGAYVHATCSSEGGRPPPVISWWKAGKQIEGITTSHTSPENSLQEFSDPVKGTSSEKSKIESDLSKQADLHSSSNDLSSSADRIDDPLLLTTKSSKNISLGKTEESDSLSNEVQTDVIKQSPKSVQSIVSNTITLVAKRSLLNVPIICQATIPKLSPNVKISSKTTAVVLNILREFMKIIFMHNI